MDRQRIDKWLWHARVVRTRTAATALVEGGAVRINGTRIDTASRPVRTGDVVTVALDRTIRVLRVHGFSERRGAATAASLLYDDLTSAPLAVVGADEAATKRPSRDERRDILKLKRRDSG